MGSNLPELLSILHSNRAQAHLLLENNRNALEDSREAMKLNSANLKVCSRNSAFATIGPFAVNFQRQVTRRSFPGLLSRSQSRFEVGGVRACSRNLQQWPES